MLQIIADALGVRLHHNILHIPEKTGTGFLKAYELAGDISVLIADVTFYDDFYMHRIPSSGYQFYVMQFNETSGGKDDGYERSGAFQHYTYNVKQNSILLTSSLMDAVFINPAHVRVRSVKIIVTKNFFHDLLGSDTADKFLSSYFASLMQNGVLDIIDLEYRLLMNALIHEKIDHPLQNKFMQNRLMMMIEKMVTEFIQQLETNTPLLKLKDDEINRLIKVELLLTKDYSGVPPTIADLSKIAAMSPTKLKKDFKTVYGLPIYEYYQKNRMQKARELLQKENCAIKEAGIMVGYTNLGHFAAAFKKEFGVLPSEMMHERKMKKDAEN